MKDLLTIKDQMSRKVSFSFPPQRIISLVPSQTEFLLDIGAPVVGRTKFCIHPREQVQQVPVIGGTKKFRFEKIRELRPDFIIGNKEENYQEGVEQLAKDFPVWMSDIYGLEDAYGMMRALGPICGLEPQAEAVINACASAMNQVKGCFSGTVIYLMWHDPWMAAGKHTFIDHILQHLGYENLIRTERYPALTAEEIRDLNPDHILFSSEPFPFKEKHLLDARSQWPGSQSQLVDGELFSWYGSRLRRWGEKG